MALKKIKKIGSAGLLAVTLTPMPVMNAVADTAVLNLNAQILASILAIQTQQDLNFGAFFAPGVPGSIKVNPVGVPTFSNITTAAATAVPGIVKIIGITGNPVIAVTTATVTLVNTGAQTMKVSQFHINTNAGGTTEAVTLTGTPLALGTRTIPIGATLNINAGQALGTYTGAVSVTANY